MLVFTSVLVLGIFFTVFIITDVRFYKQRKVNSMISLAQVIGSNSISTLQFQNNEAAKGILSELHNVAPEIVHAAIIDKQGKIFASYSKDGYQAFQIPATLNTRTAVFTDQYLLVRNDILFDKELLGKVILEVELSELTQIKADKVRIASISLLVAIVFTFLIAILIQTYISRRLLNVINTMKEVSSTGNYDKTITDNGKDELSTLIQVFNNLMLHVKESQQRKDEFISIVSHELKTPLTTIKGYLELLDVMEEKQPNKQFVQKGLANVKKLEKLISDLLDVSKIQSGQLKLEMNEFNIDEMVNETIAVFQMVSGNYEITRTRHLNGEIILADRHRIEQVLTNLLSNAIKYSPGEKKVIVDSQKKDGELIIRVRDYGMGVAKEEQSNIFERFYRSKHMSDTIVGFGLGLYICRDIIVRHDGKIWVEREEKGSSFYFSLPLKKTSSVINKKTASAKTID